MTSPENPITMARMSQPVTSPRTTFSLNVYHQLMGEDAKQFPFNGDYLHEIVESAWDRTITIESKFVKLDFGWLTPEMIRTIIIYNVTGLGRSVKPTPEEIEADATAVIVFSTLPGIEVAPKLLPTTFHVDKSFKGLSVRSLGSPARIRYIGIPR